MRLKENVYLVFDQNTPADKEERVVVLVLGEQEDRGKVKIDECCSVAKDLVEELFAEELEQGEEVEFCFQGDCVNIRPERALTSKAIVVRCNNARKLNVFVRENKIVLCLSSSTWVLNKEEIANFVDFED